MTRKKKVVKKGPPAKLKSPYLQFATICENILEDKDGTFSVIRIVDKFTVRIQAVSGTQAVPLEVLRKIPAVVSFQAVVAFKSGNCKGKRTLRLIPRDLKGNPIAEVNSILVFEGGEHGAMLRAPMTLAVQEAGLYWIDVMLNGELVTKIPMKVVYAEEAADSILSKGS